MTTLVENISFLSFVKTEKVKKNKMEVRIYEKRRK